MESSTSSQPIGRSRWETAVATIGRVLWPIGTFLIVLYLLYLGFIFLREGDAPRIIITLVAIIWGVGGVAFLYWISNKLVELLPSRLRTSLVPFVFVGPTVLILTWYLALPALRTLWLSLFERTGPPKGLNILEQLTSESFVGLANYQAVFSEGLMLEAFRNNMMWIVFGSTFSVVFGLAIAALADRSRFEKIAKSFIFLPMAISFVGSSIIWKFIYEYRPIDQPQIGLLNAIVTSLGGTPQAWPQWVAVAPWNNMFLIVIVIWLQAGFCMVLFSAALKGIPPEIIEASRIDGANELQTFFRIMLPYIFATVISVWTTIIIFTLKIFDVVWVTTRGQFGTHVIATQFYRQTFTNRNSGLGSAIAIVLLIAVIPVMIYNLKQFREREMS